jgi:Tripartite tricarboxylate transporter family receptor
MMLSGEGSVDQPAAGILEPIGSPPRPESFKMLAGVDMVHVPYRGAGLALTDLIGGQVQAPLTTCLRPSGTSGRVNFERSR